jgi:hypothetical protein
MNDGLNGEICKPILSKNLGMARKACAQTALYGSVSSRPQPPQAAYSFIVLNLFIKIFFLWLMDVYENFLIFSETNLARNELARASYAIE